jgi:hypothetical protein
MRRVGWIQEAGNAAAGRRRAYQVTTTGRALLAAELKRLERLLRYATPALAGGPGSPEGPEGG